MQLEIMRSHASQKFVLNNYAGGVFAMEGLFMPPWQISSPEGEWEIAFFSSPSGEWEIATMA